MVRKLYQALRSILPTIAFLLGSASAQAQATARVCSGSVGEVPGPACLVAHQDLGTLPAGPVYWNVYAFADAAMADRMRPLNGIVVWAFDQVWVFEVGANGRELEGGRHLAAIGPLPIGSARAEFSAEFLKSTFEPGMKAPLHVHSGPEAFFVLSGSTCLETPDGIQVGRGANHSLTVKGGPPMLLMAIGRTTRKGFALILHVEGTAPTTLTPDWSPKDLCPKD